MSRYYTDEFKQKIVELKKSGKHTKDLVREYQISKTSVQQWETI